MALFLILLGLYPHLRFSLSMGELSFFKGAYDEDTYFNLMRSGIVFRNDRALSFYALKFLYELTGHSANLTLIAADLVFPVLAGIAAYVLAAQQAGRWLVRLALALALLLAADILSLANAAVWMQWNVLGRLRSLFGAWGPMLVPSPDVAYLEIFRTPEPQVSYIVTFVAWALLIRIARRTQAPVTGELALLAGVNVALPWAYLFTTLPTLALQTWLAVAMLRHRRMTAVWLLLITAAAAVATALGVSGDAKGNMFPSHLPVVSPATVLGAASIVVVGGLLMRRGQKDLVLWLALGFVALPFVMANQQIVTGVMPTAREWERYVSFQLLVTGLALALPAGFAAIGIRAGRVIGYGSAFAVLLSVILMVRAQALTYRYFEALNVNALATARALESAGPAVAAARVLLDDVNLVPQVTARRPLPPPRFVIDYTGNFLDPVPEMDRDGGAPDSPHAQSLFEYWWRTGVPAEAAEAVLRADAAARGGFFSAFVFNMHDFLGVMTDNRAIRPEAVARAIPTVIDRYRAYLIAALQKADPMPVILLTAAKPSDVRTPSGLTNRLLGTGNAGAATIYAYRQERLE